MRATDAVGQYGERLAERHVRALGWVVLDRNWRCDLGEIDIVARDGDCLVVCEVKTRRSLAYGHPVEAVTRAKVARLRRLAARWVAESGLHPAAVRVDVLAVLRPRTGAAQVEHVRGVA